MGIALSGARKGRGNKEKAAETADLLADPLDIGLP